jgi:DNA-directed RNA polymerase specialized sigma24 family protein
MTAAMHSVAPLDDLATAACSGDSGAEAELFEHLRVRFHAVAKRRVREDDLDDVVQDALQVVFAKFRTRAAPVGILVWSLAVLRNVIGNHYQARARVGQHTSLDEARHAEAVRDGGAGGVEGELELAELTGTIETAIRMLAARDTRCGHIFAIVFDQLAGREDGVARGDGGGRQDGDDRTASILELVRRRYPSMSRGSFYVALHRCRQRLRAIVHELDAELLGSGDPAR